MRRTDRQSKPVGGADRGHRGDFRGCSLRVGEVVLPDFLVPVTSKVRSAKSCEMLVPMKISPAINTAPKISVPIRDLG